MTAVSAARARPAQDDVFLNDVLEGLSRPDKSLPCKYFYDAEGSALFDEICTLDEYYPTRTETALLHAHAGEIAGLAGRGATLVELGSGSSVKVRILLDALDAPAMYVPVDISRDHLIAAAARLAGDYPAVTVVPVPPFAAQQSVSMRPPRRVAGREGETSQFRTYSPVARGVVENQRNCWRSIKSFCKMCLKRWTRHRACRYDVQ